MELATAKISRRAVQTIWNPIHNELCDFIEFVAITQVERVFNPDRKDHHWGKRKLARDRLQAIHRLVELGLKAKGK
jgi:hypothetical protein